MNSKNKSRSLATGQDPELIRSFRGHTGIINGVSISPDMKSVASCSTDSIAHVWSFKPDIRPYKFIGHKQNINCISFSPNGQTIATGGTDKIIRLWKNSVQGKCVEIKAHSAPIRDLHYSKDNTMLLSSSNDKILKIWQANGNHKFLFSLQGHNNWINQGQFSPDARLIGSASDDKTVKIWETDQQKLLCSLHDHNNKVGALKFHPDGTCVAAADHDGKLKLWDLRTMKLIQHYDAHNSAIGAICFNPNGYYLASTGKSSEDSTVKIWDLRQGRQCFTLQGHEGGVNTLSFSEGGEYFATGGGDNLVMVWKSNMEQVQNDKMNDSLFKSNKVKPFEKIVEVVEQPAVPLQSSTVFENDNIDKKLSENLSSHLEKIVNQLETISKTVLKLDGRLSTTEDQLKNFQEDARLEMIQELANQISLQSGCVWEKFNEKHQQIPKQVLDSEVLKIQQVQPKEGGKIFDNTLSLVNNLGLNDFQPQNTNIFSDNALFNSGKFN